MWPIMEKENRQLLLLWPNLIRYSKLYECVVTVLLLTLTPLDCMKESILPRVLPLYIENGTFKSIIYPEVVLLLNQVPVVDQVT